LGDDDKTVYTTDVLPPGSHTIEAHTSDGGFDSPTVTRNFTILASPFDTITFNQTHVKARHILDLRTAVNNVRNYYGLAAYTWDMEITPGKTLVAYWPFHILELRAALDAVVDIVNNHDGQIMPVSWIPLAAGRPRANVMNQLMDTVLKI